MNLDNIHKLVICSMSYFFSTMYISKSDQPSIILFFPPEPPSMILNKLSLREIYNKYLHPNVLSKDDKKEENAGDFINTAGDEMAFITMNAFLCFV